MSRKKKEYLTLLEGQVPNPPRLELTKRDIGYLYNLDDCCFPSVGYLKWEVEFKARKEACIREWRDTPVQKTLF